MEKLSAGVFLSGLLLLSFSTVAVAQVQDPAHWTFAAKKKSADTFEITLTAVLDQPWHIYSQNSGKGGPTPTYISFKANPSIVFSGQPKELGRLVKVFDKYFMANVLYYSNRVQFVTTVKVKGTGSLQLSGTVDYAVSDDHQLLPPTRKSFDIRVTRNTSPQKRARNN
jgi:thiol:disulfide interchange protein DsbD